MTEAKHASHPVSTATVGYVRIRKRTLKGGTPERPSRRFGGARSSVSFDIVRAVRVNGKSRQRFVLGLGPLTDERERHQMRFWVNALGSMRRYGLDAQQRRKFAFEMVRKGAPLPTAAECDEFDHEAQRIHDEATALEVRELRSAYAGWTDGTRQEVNV